MQVTRLSFRKPVYRLARLWPLLAAFAFTPRPALPDFWSLKDNKPETVKLIRKLPPVANRSGNTVQFLTETPGSVPAEAATVLRDKIRTMLLNTKSGSIQLVDGPADTIIKCIITGFEPKVVRTGQRQVGVQHQTIVTWIGNIEASVQILDRQNRPIDAANLKHHLENDYVVQQSEEKVASVTDKKASIREKLAGGVKVLQSGARKSDVASLAGGGQQISGALSVGDKGGRPPTDLEWRNALIEGLAAKVANRIVPVDQEFVAVLPVDNEFRSIREFAKSDRWGDVQEQTEKMSPLSGSKEAFRLYMLALSYEALAYRDPEHPKEAAELLNKSTKYYDDASKIDAREREFLLAQIRVQDSLDHYLDIQRYIHNRPAATATTADSTIPPQTPGAPGGGAQGGSDRDNVAGNAILIEMAKMPGQEATLLTFVQTTPDPKFDVSPSGLLQLMRANVPAKVIAAVQKRMAPSAPAAAPPGRTPPAPAKK
jgi:hypothetical protein